MWGRRFCPQHPQNRKKGQGNNQTWLHASLILALQASLILALQKLGQEELGFKAIFGYLASSRPAWTTGWNVSQTNSEKVKEELESWLGA